MEKPILKGWEEYKKAVLPPNASRIQMEETYKAFMAGAWHIYAEIMKNTAKQETEAVKFLDLLYEELQEYQSSFLVTVSTSN